MKITATTSRLRVDYRLAGKVYNESAEVGVFDDGQRTSYPFDSTDVDAGQTFDVPAGADVVRVVEYK
jgi:hypothetical protein